MREADAVHGIGRSLQGAGSGCMAIAIKLLFFMILFALAAAILG